MRALHMGMVGFGVLLTTSVSLADGHKSGERILAMRSGTNSFFAAVVVTASDDGGSVKFDDGTVQQYGPITFEPSLRPFDWKVGTQIECSPSVKTTVDVGDAESDKLTRGAITSIGPKEVELSVAGKPVKFALATCRHHRTWWDELSEGWRNYAKYPNAKAFPTGTKTVSPSAVASAMSDYLSGADGGSYIVIKKCTATGNWVKLTSGSEITARTVDVACGIAIPLPPKPRENFACIIQYGSCRQPYEGGGVYGDCEWKNTTKTSEQISCAALK